jgi:exonuclease SbcC
MSVTRRLEALDATLSAAPPTDDVTAALDALAVLEARAEAARTARVEARDAREIADQHVRSLAEQLRTARTRLASARDPLVVLGAPALPDSLPLGEAWERLTAWAVAAAAGREEARNAVVASHEEETRSITRLSATMRTLLEDAGVDGCDPRPVTVWAPPAVASARTAAEAAVRAVEAARARCEGLRAQIDTARDGAHVANKLAQQLASNGFPRWLTKSALGVLVTAASTTLMELSGGQFELGLADDNSAAFTIIDHTDADAVRSVKTLSGGETFQASLALALALSTHLGALASNGAAQLDAIFIDEGFGTLDEATLDSVATTLETLASGAERMVGVITHVPALAARVPVRFVVQRDPRGSTIQRVSA